jgi:hypothetical protein
LDGEGSGLSRISRRRDGVSHHREDQPGERYPRCRWFSLRANSSGRRPSVRSARTGGCGASLEALVTDPAATEGLYGSRPAEGGNKAAKLKVIREALRSAKRVWLATDCDREGQLIGQEILEHYGYRGQVIRVLFTEQDSQTIRDAFARAKRNSEYASMYAAAVARRQADQIYNLSLTRTATVVLGALRGCSVPRRNRARAALGRMRRLPGPAGGAEP